MNDDQFASYSRMTFSADMPLGSIYLRVKRRIDHLARLLERYAATPPSAIAVATCRPAPFARPEPPAPTTTTAYSCVWNLGIVFERARLVQTICQSLIRPAATIHT